MKFPEPVEMNEDMFADIPEEGNQSGAFSDLFRMEVNDSLDNPKSKVIFYGPEFTINYR